MRCTINTIRKEAYKINKNAKFDAIGVYIPKDGNIVPEQLRFSKATNEAKRLVKELNERFNSIEYGKVAYLGFNFTNGRGITIKVPGRLQKAYDLKEAKITAEEYIKFLEEDKTPIDLTEEEIHTEEDYDDWNTYNELSTTLSESLNDSEMSAMMLKYQENSEPLFSPTLNEDEDTSSKTDWENKRLELIEKLEKVRKEYSKQDRLKVQKKIKYVNNLIKNIQKELADFDKTNKESVRNSIENEIDFLNNIINNTEYTSKKLAQLFESNLIEDRIKTLKDQFNRGSMEAIMEERFNNLFTEVEFRNLKDKVTDLEKNYNNSLERFIKGLIEEHDVVKTSTSSLSDKELEKFQERITELLSNLKLYDGGQYGHKFLGVKSYDNILAELLGLIQTTNDNKEEGKTGILKTLFNNSYEKIKHLKIEGKPLTDALFQKDVFGVMTNKLIRPFSENFYKKVYDEKKGIKKVTSEFYKNLHTKSPKLASSYRKMQVRKKLNVDFIKPYMISSIKNKYSSHPELQEFFTFSDIEMQQYEKEMRSKMGDIAFEMSLEKTIENIELFLNDDSVYNKYHINPFNYIKHFYSDNYQNYDANTFEYLLPKYTNFIPSLNEELYNEYYNKEFKSIENQNFNGFKDFYKSLSSILSYINEVNPDADVNSIQALRDNTGRAALEELNTGGKIRRLTWEWIKGLFNKYYEGPFENRNRDEDYDITEDRKVNTGYSSYGKNEIIKNTEIQAKKSLKELLKIAEKEGLIIKKNLPDTPHIRKTLAKSIATHQINKSSSLDLLKRVNGALDISASYASRVNTYNSVKFIQEFIKNSSNNVNLNISTFIENFLNLNVYKTGFIYGSAWANLERVPVKIMPKKYTEAQKIYKNLLEEELKKGNGEGSFNFSIKDIKYKSVVKDGITSYRKIKEGENFIEIDEKEIQKEYVNYLKNEIDNLGVEPILGSILNGVVDNVYSAYLALSPITGIKNRAAGKHQNNQAAASELHGFNTEGLLVSRRFLELYNTNKYTKNLKFNVIKENRRIQHTIFNNILENYGLLDKVYDEVIGETSGTAKINQTRSSFKKFMGDFAMNNPEFHNQGELVLAMLQKVMIEKIDRETGDIIKVPFFNPETKSFPLDINMNLLPEYQTPENKKNWVDNEGDVYSSFINNYKTTKGKLHGDYSGNKIGLETSMTSKTFTVMLKWAFENANNEWGSKKISLLKGEVDVKGRKLILAKHAPSLAMHLTLQNFSIPGLMSIGAFAGASPWLAGGAVLGGGIALAVTLKTLRKKDVINLSFSKEELALSYGYFIETYNRVIRSTVNSLTGNRVDLKKFSGNQDWIYRKGNTTISERDRALLSESSQQLADKMNVYFQYALGAVFTQFLYSLLVIDEDDDEEDIARKMKGFESKFNFLLNTRNSITSDAELWTSPSGIKNLAEAQIVYNFVKRGFQNTVKSYQKYNDNEISGKEFGYSLYDAVSTTAFGTPKKLNNLLKPFMIEDYDFFGDKRVYDNSQKTVLDNVIKRYHLKGEPKYKKLFEDDKRYHRETLDDIFKLKVKEYRKKRESQDYKTTVKEDAKTLTKQFLNKYNINARSGRTYQMLYEKVDWDALIEEAEKIKF